VIGVDVSKLGAVEPAGPAETAGAVPGDPAGLAAAGGVA
jgi:hypothetical protein